MLKESKIKRLRKIIKSNSFFIICSDSSIKVEDSLQLRQELSKLNLYCYRVNNKLLQNVYKKSIFKNYVCSVHGSIMLVISSQKNMCSNFSVIKNELTKFNIDILGVYFNFKIYSINQLQNFFYLSYDKNVIVLYKTFRSFLKRPLYKFIEPS